MNSIRAISLDLDDTLWAVGPVIRRAEAAVWTWFGERYPRIGDRFSQASAAELRQRLAARYSDRAHDYTFLRARVYAQMAAEAGYPDSVAEEAFEVFFAARNSVELFPDVAPALEALALRYPIVALTNGNACLDTIGISRHFRDIVRAADAGVAKPAAAIFHAAADAAGVPPDAVVHVGDHPQLDVVGAAEAGLRTVWINRGNEAWPDHLPRPDATLDSMAALDELLRDTTRADD